VERIRDYVSESGAHKRSAENLAELEAALCVFCDFALDAHAITDLEATDLRARVCQGLKQAAAAQRHEQESVLPARRFLKIVLTVMSIGRGHVADPKKDEPPVNPSEWGWRFETPGGWRPQGECFGWLDERNLYLDSDASYAAVHRFLHDAGQELGVSQRNLASALQAEGVLLGSEEDRDSLKVRRTIRGRRRPVLWLNADSLSPRFTPA